MQLKRYYNEDAFNFYQLMVKVQEVELTREQRNLAILIAKELFHADDIVLITNETHR